MRTSNVNNLAFAREMRKQPTLAEKGFWKAVRNRKLGLKWRRQHPFDSYILDLYCPELRIAIELDGDSHLGRSDYDEARVAHLTSKGILVLRFRNSALKTNRDGVIEGIDAAIELQRGKLNKR